jgi:hypothetical protein
MLIVLLSYLNIFFAGLGTGLLSLRIAGIKIPPLSKHEILATSLLGFCMNLALSQLISLFLPVNGISNGILTICASGIILSSYKISELCKIFSFKISLPNTLSFNLPFFFLFLFSLYFTSLIPQIKDTWFYHLQAILWTENYGTVIGLGNLFSNLAYNSAVFTGNALFGLKGINGQNYFGINTFLWITTLLMFALRTRKHLIAKQTILALADTFIVMLLFRYFYLWLSSASPDPAAAFLLVLAFFMYTDSNRSEINRLSLPLLLISLVTFKLNNIFFLVPAFYLLWKSLKQKQFKPFSLLFFPALILIPWLIRNVMLSGYLFYPLTFPDLFSFDWKIPPAQAFYESALIRSWAMYGILPDAPVQFFPLQNWLPAWLHAIGNFNILLLFLSFLSPILTTFLPPKKHSLPLTLTLTLTLTLLTAPSPRFMMGVMLISIVFPLFLYPRLLNNRINSIMLPALLLLTVFSIEPALLRTHLKYPSPFSILRPARFPISEARPIQYNNISLHYTDPAIALESYATAPPNTPQLRQGLQARGNHPSQGYRINPDSLSSSDNHFSSIKQYYQHQTISTQAH